MVCLAAFLCSGQLLSMTFLPRKTLSNTHTHSHFTLHQVRPPELHFPHGLNRRKYNYCCGCCCCCYCCYQNGYRHRVDSSIDNGGNVGVVVVVAAAAAAADTNCRAAAAADAAPGALAVAAGCGGGGGLLLQCRATRCRTDRTIRTSPSRRCRRISRT